MSAEDCVRNAPPRTLNSSQAIIICNIIVMMTIACRHRHHRNLTSWPFICTHIVLNMMMHQNLRASMHCIWAIKLNIFEHHLPKSHRAHSMRSIWKNPFRISMQAHTASRKELHGFVLVEDAAYFDTICLSILKSIAISLPLISEIPSSQQIVNISIDTDTHLWNCSSLEENLCVFKLFVILLLFISNGYCAKKKKKKMHSSTNNNLQQFLISLRRFVHNHLPLIYCYCKHTIIRMGNVDAAVVMELQQQCARFNLDKNPAFMHSCDKHSYHWHHMCSYTHTHI